LILAIGVSAPLASSVADEPKGDLARLQGSWTTRLGPNKETLITLAIKGSTFDVKVKRPDGQEILLKGELKVDDKAEPKTFDFVNFKGEEGREIPDNLGIYKLDADTWTTCSGGPGNPRPTKFEAGEGGPPNLGAWTRVKDAAADKPLPGDLAKIQGTWQAGAGPDDQVMIKLTVKENAYTARWDPGDGTKVEIRGELRMNDKATPNKTVDFFKNQRNDGEDARDNLGIYEITADTFKLCVGGAGNERPTEFKAGEGGAPLLLKFTRKKD
jgi:uncharacterized protein (TIGR03067 family)